MSIGARPPQVQVGDWVSVEGFEGVVSMVRSVGGLSGECEVVCNPDKPANRNVKWSGGVWRFVMGNEDFGGYADKSARLKPFVEQLKRGR